MTKHEEAEVILERIHAANVASERSESLWAKDYWSRVLHVMQRKLQTKLNEIDKPEPWIQVVKVDF
jgi:hypothetical protein